MRPRVYSCLSTSAAPLLAVVRFKTQQQQQATKTVFFSHFLFVFVIVFVYCCAIVISPPLLQKSEKKLVKTQQWSSRLKLYNRLIVWDFFVAVVSLLWMWWVCNMVFFKVVLNKSYGWLFLLRPVRKLPVHFCSIHWINWNQKLKTIKQKNFCWCKWKFDDFFIHFE